MRVLGLCLVLLMSANVCLADEKLKGLKEINVWIFGLDKEAEECGLKSEDLRTSLNLPIGAYTKLRQNVGASTSLVLSLLSMKAGNICVSTISLRIHVFEKVRLPFQDKDTYATVVLYNNRGLYTHQMKNPTNLLQGVEKLAKDFALTWQEANPN